MKDTVPNRPVKVTTNQARKILKEGYELDALKGVDTIRVAQIADLRSIVDLQRQQLTIIEERERNLKLAFDGQTLLINDWKSRLDESEKLRKRAVRWGRFKVVLIGGAVGYIIYQSIK